jgi:hypothetical protein
MVIRTRLFSWLALFNWEGLCHPHDDFLVRPEVPGSYNFQLSWAGVLNVMRPATRIASRNSRRDYYESKKSQNTDSVS